MDKNINVLDIIVTFVKAIKETPKNKEKMPYYYFDDKENRIWGAKYLLGQILRQYRLDANHIIVSKRADELWKEITGEESIHNHGYRDVIKSKVDRKIIKYSGASKKGENAELKVGESFIWNDIFHDEHVIPIADIIEHLISLDELNYGNVQNILNNIYMCRILKEENAGLTHKRPFSVVKAIEEVYNSKGIEILGWEEKKKNL